MPRKVIPVDPSNWRLHDPGVHPSALTHCGLPDNEFDALLRAAPNEPLLETAEERGRYNPDDDTTGVIDALASMTSECALVLQLVYGQGMSLREVERYTGIPKTTVARRRDEGKHLLAIALGRPLPSR